MKILLFHFIAILFCFETLLTVYNNVNLLPFVYADHQYGTIHFPVNVTHVFKISSEFGDLNVTLLSESNFGIAVQYLGDLDEDGTEDIAIGSDDDMVDGIAHGAIYILFLDTDGTTKTFIKIGYNENFTGFLDTDNQFGSAIADLHDLNNDDIHDLAVGARKDHNIGAVWILFMKTSGVVDTHVKLSSTDDNSLANQLDTEDRFGTSVTWLKDIDDDDISDLGVGAYKDDDIVWQAGAIYLITLSSVYNVKTYWKINNLTENMQSIDLTGNDRLGSGFNLIGGYSDDLDRDGGVDCIVGAQYHNDPDDILSGTGAAFIIFLKTDNSVRTYTKISNTSGSFTATIIGSDYFGICISSMNKFGTGDIDGDLIQDFAAGSRSDDGGNSRGALHIVMLTTHGTVKTWAKISSLSPGFTGWVDNGDLFAYSLEFFDHDFNDDGQLDFLAGSLWDDDGNANSGAVYILSLDSSISPIPSPTLSPTFSPTPSPTRSPTKSPTLSPTRLPTPSPTPSPTRSPTFSPTLAPTIIPEFCFASNITLTARDNCSCAHPSCKICDFINDTVCYVCGGHTYLEDGQCVECHESCVTCHGGTSYDCDHCSTDHEILVYHHCYNNLVVYPLFGCIFFFFILSVYSVARLKKLSNKITSEPTTQSSTLIFPVHSWSILLYCLSILEFLTAIIYLYFEKMSHTSYYMWYITLIFFSSVYYIIYFRDYYFNSKSYFLKPLIFVQEYMKTRIKRHKEKVSPTSSEEARWYGFSTRKSMNQHKDIPPTVSFMEFFDSFSQSVRINGNHLPHRFVSMLLRLITILIISLFLIITVVLSIILLPIIFFIFVEGKLIAISELTRFLLGKPITYSEFYLLFNSSLVVNMCLRSMPLLILVTLNATQASMNSLALFFMLFLSFNILIISVTFIARMRAGYSDIKTILEAPLESGSSNTPYSSKDFNDNEAQTSKTYEIPHHTALS